MNWHRDRLAFRSTASGFWSVFFRGVQSVFDIFPATMSDFYSSYVSVLPAVEPMRSGDIWAGIGAHLSSVLVRENNGQAYGTKSRVIKNGKAITCYKVIFKGGAPYAFRIRPFEELGQQFNVCAGPGCSTGRDLVDRVAVSRNVRRL